MKTALVLGAGGFIGNHMVNRLKAEGYWVRGVDLKYPEYGKTQADHFVIRDLRDRDQMSQLIGYAGCRRDPHQIYARQFDKPFDEIYQFAADMGGAGYIFTGDHDADVMHNSATINLNLLDAIKEYGDYHTKSAYPMIFYSSSACMYPEHNQLDPDNPNCAESSAYPANPDSEYGWEKLFSERLYLAYNRNYHIPVRIARFHNIYGPLGTWDGGREKAPAAICRKVINSGGNPVEIWGDGKQTRSFLYIDDCIDAVRLLMKSSCRRPLNIGSEEMVTINELVDLAAEIGEKIVEVRHIDGPQGVRGRNSDNRLIFSELGWVPRYDLKAGLTETYKWIEGQVNRKNS